MGEGGRGYLPSGYLSISTKACALFIYALKLTNVFKQSALNLNLKIL